MKNVTEKQVEFLAGLVHDSYIATCDKLGWSLRDDNRVDYSELSEDSKELDRATVHAVLDNVEGCSISPSMWRTLIECLQTQSQPTYQVDTEGKKLYIIEMVLEKITEDSLDRIDLQAIRFDDVISDKFLDKHELLGFRFGENCRPIFKGKE